MDVESRGNFDRGKVVVNLACYHGTRLLVSLFIPVGGENLGKGGGWGEDICLPATSFTLIENMIIWCKIQVIIYPFTVLCRNS